MKYPLVKPVFYISLLKELLQFIKNPKLKWRSEKSSKAKVYDTVGLFLIKLVLLLPVALFFALVYDPVNVQSANMQDRFSPLIFLCVGGIILPLLEETAFRLSLRFKPLYLAISISALSYYVLTKLVFSTKMSAVDESFLFRVGISLTIGLAVLPILNSKGVRERLIRFWNAHFPTIYYISCLVFAWIHITKYELSLTNVLLLPILTLPQLISALIYGYLRVAYGFQYPLLLHMSNNLIAIGLSLLPFMD